jgi:hypothetical protein
MTLLWIIVFFTILEAVHEGLALRGKGTVAGMIEAIKLAGLPALIIVVYFDTQYDQDYFNPFYPWKFYRFFLPHFILGWLFVRYALFDGIHNLAAKLDLYYIGTVKFYDRILARITKKQYPGPTFWIPRILLLAAGVSLLLRI